jgi:heme-degrading monooxygenase HmoA
MFAAIYHWKINEGMESDFVQNWNKGTSFIRDMYGSSGAALHKAADGTYWSYARWPNKAAWQKMMDDKNKPFANGSFAELIGEKILLDVVSDLLK